MFISLRIWIITGFLGQSFGVKVCVCAMEMVLKSGG